MLVLLKQLLLSRSKLQSIFHVVSCHFKQTLHPNPGILFMSHFPTNYYYFLIQFLIQTCGDGGYSLGMCHNHKNQQVGMNSINEKQSQPKILCISFLSTFAMLTRFLSFLFI